MSKFPFNPTGYTPLKPFGSKMGDRKINENGSPDLNYSFIAFDASSELRSADLNEMQENAFFEKTAIYDAVNNWAFYQGEPVESNGASESYMRGIGDNIKKFDETIRVGGPFWDGATPMFPKPEEKTSVAKPESFRRNYRRAFTINQSESQIRIVFKPSYYYTTIKTGIPGDDGYKHLVYLDDTGNTGAFEIIFDKQETGVTVVGLQLDQTVIYPQTSTSVGLDTDPDLTVNDYGTHRIKYFFKNATYSHVANPGTGDFLNVDLNDPVGYDPDLCARTTDDFQECKECVNNSSSPELGPRILCDQYLKLHRCWLKHRNDNPTVLSGPYCSNVCEQCNLLLSERYYQGRYASGCACTKNSGTYVNSFSPVLYVDYINKEIRYMNNLLLTPIS